MESKLRFGKLASAAESCILGGIIGLLVGFIIGATIVWSAGSFISLLELNQILNSERFDYFKKGSLLLSSIIGFVSGVAIFLYADMKNKLKRVKNQKK